MGEKNNIFSYLKWRGDLSFAQDPFNEVASLILSVIAYLNLVQSEKIATIVPALAPSLAEVSLALEGKKNNRLAMISVEEIIDVLHLAAQTERFREVKALGYICHNDEEVTMQFAAVTFLLPNEEMYVAYRGTDDTLVGWKEDLIMSYAPYVAAQEEALEYLKYIAEQIPKKAIYAGGHSKGGNLAVYAAVKAPEEIKKRLRGVYNNDGPGFQQEFLLSEEYKSLSPLIHTFIPESSIVGMLLEHEESYKVIASSAKAFLQHAPLSWEVMGKSFVYLESRSQFGLHSDNVIRNWLKTCTNEEKEEFVEALFNILASGRARTLWELTEGDFLHHWRTMLKTYSGLDKEKKDLLNDLLKRLMGEIKKEAIRDNKILRKIEETF